jgi:hypothetical protein
MSPSALKRVAALATLVVVGALVMPVASQAKGVSEPAAAGIAWYWETQQKQEIKDPVGNTHTVMGPNPFCPSAPGDLGAPGQTCAQGRLPVEVVAGDYTTPDKLSAVNFDFSLVPIGSKISKFEVTFLEAKGGCYDKDGNGQPGPEDECERTDPINVGDHELQACQVTDFFGTGSARPYNELPKYECTKTDPVAKREEVDVKGADDPLGEEDSPDFTWTFDLTPLAKDWTSGTTQTSILIAPKAPKGYDEDNQERQDAWRVVLVGPEDKQGLVTALKFTAPPTPVPPPVETGTETDTGTDTGLGTDFGSGTTDFGSGSSDTGTDFGTDTGAGGDTGDDTATDTGTETLDPVAADAPAPPGPESFPMYMWLAILAGLVGFYLVRSVVVEATTGVRPNGVLAQIKSLNAGRSGAAVESAADGSSGGVASALGAVGQGFSGFAGKVKSVFKRG